MRKARLHLAVAVAACLAQTGPAPGASTYWQVASGNWSTGAAWDNGEPGASDWAVINNYGTARITQNGEVCYRLTLGNAGRDGAIEMSSGTLDVGYAEFLSANGGAMFNQSGGTHTVGEWLEIAHSSTGIGEYNLSGGTLTVGRHEVVGMGSSGWFTQTGGTHTTDWLTLGYYAGSDGTYTLWNGSLTCQPVFIGLNGQGSFVQHGGTHTVLHHFKLGNHAGSEGTYTLNDGTLDARHTIFIGMSGTGTLTLNGGTVIANRVNLGSTGTFSPGGDSRLRVNYLDGFGRVSTFGGALEIGHSGGDGAGSFTRGANLTVHENLTVGYDAPGTFRPARTSPSALVVHVR